MGGENEELAGVVDPLERPTLPQRAPSQIPPKRLEEGEVVARRFEILELLGTGGYGEVYRVHDRRRDREMALKIHRVGTLGARARSILEGEFELLSSLRHPNLVGVEDFGVAEGHYAWLSQPLVRGQPLNRTRNPIDSPRGLDWIAQLLRALDYLHGRGFVHGDVKPLNVLVDEPTDRLVLLDFGVSRALGAMSPEFEGSPDFMAPEVIHGMGADGRSDLYSLGCSIHALLRGEPPFYRSTARETFMAHLLAPVPPLPDGVSPAFASWAERLLAKEPDKRFPSAWAALQSLGAATGQRFERDTPATLSSQVAHAPLTGRDEVLGELLAAVAADDGRVCVVEGPPGSGKSRVLAELRRRHQVDGGRHIEIRGLRDEQTAVLALTRAVLDPFQRQALDDEQRRALAYELPELRRPRELLPEPVDLDAAARARRRILGELLAVRSQRQHLVVAVEDLHSVGWDEQERLADVFEAARAAGMRGTVILATRPGGVNPRWPAGPHIHSLSLSPLRPDELRSVAEALVGPGVLDGTELGDRLLASEGSAFHVRESIRLFVDEGRLVRDGTGRFVPEGPLRWREPWEVVEERVRLSSRAGRTAALALATWSRPATVAELARVAGQKPSKIIAGLAELLERGLVERVERFRRGALHVLHEAYVDAVLVALPRRRRDVAARRAAQLVLRHADGDAQELARAAAFHERAGEEEAASELLREASAVAQRSGRIDEALRLSRTLSRFESPPDPMRLLREHDLALRLGRRDDARAVLAMAEELGAPVGELTWRRGFRAVREGQVGRARELCKRPLSAASGVTRLRLLEVLGKAASMAGDLEVSWRHYREAAALAEELGESPATSLLGQALVETELGQSEAGESARRAVSAAQASDDAELLGDAQRAMGRSRRRSGDRRGAERSFRQSLRLARARGDVEREALAMVELGGLALDRGHADRAIELWERALALEEQVGATGPSLLSRLRLGQVLKGCGRAAEAALVLTPVLGTEAHGMGVVVGLAWSQRGDLLALEGDDEAALECYGRANGVLDQHPNGRSEALAGRMRALLRRGEVGRAATDLQLMGLLAEHTDRPLDHRRHAVARGRFSEEEGDLEAALAAASEAVALDAPRTVYRDIYGTKLEASWLEVRALEGLGRSPSRALQRTTRWFDRLSTSFEDQAHGELFRSATPLRCAIAQGDLAARW